MGRDILNKMSSDQQRKVRLIIFRNTKLKKFTKWQQIILLLLVSTLLWRLQNIDFLQNGKYSLNDTRHGCLQCLSTLKRKEANEKTFQSTNNNKTEQTNFVADASNNCSARVSVIFSSLYGLHGDADRQNVYQERWAVQSWSKFGIKLHPNFPPLILALVDNGSFCDPWLQKIPNFYCVSLQCSFNHSGIPTIPCMYKEAAKYAEPGTLAMYVNGDIILSERMADVVNSTSSVFGESFQVVGERKDIIFPDWLREMPESELERLENYAQNTGVSHGEWGMDYFIFPAKHLLDPFPPFLVGRWRWDNVMLLKMLLWSTPTVDVSEATKVIHFGKGVSFHEQRSGAKRNDQLAWEEFGPLFFLGRLSNVPFTVKWHSDQAEVCTRAPRDKAALLDLKNGVARSEFPNLVSG